MRLDNFIRIKLIELSKKYEVSLIEIQKPVVKTDKVIISKTFTFNYKLRNESPTKNTTETFHSKRELVSWLLCLK